MGEIPVLEHDGVRLTQTAPILLGLAERYGRFGGTDDSERFELLPRRRPMTMCWLSCANGSTAS
jgi:glutathione S-transferase